MKPIQYYCGNDFDTTQGREITALQYLHRKIHAAKELKNKLALEWPIDGVRITRINTAITDWQAQISEMFHGKEPQ